MLPDIATNTLQLRWFPWHLLHNHHCDIKWRANSSLLSSPHFFKHYKNPNETGYKHAISRVFPIFLSLRVLAYLKVWLRLRRVYLDNLSGHLYAGTTKAQSPAFGQRLSLPPPNEESILSWSGINIGAVYGNEIKMSTPSRSRSSTIGSKGYFNWHESMHRCQQKSERQMQALLHETRRFREENEVLHI